MGDLPLPVISGNGYGGRKLSPSVVGFLRSIYKGFNAKKYEQY